MSSVKFNGKTVSDKNLKGVLNNIAEVIGNVIVISGDRSYVPKGGSKTSLHLSNQAVDFYIEGMSLDKVYRLLKEKEKDIFDPNKKYEVIFHGKYTQTGGTHIHIGRYPNGKGVLFKFEGLTKNTKGKYRLDTKKSQPKVKKQLPGPIKKSTIPIGMDHFFFKKRTKGTWL